jgi:hypothetical protein
MKQPRDFIDAEVVILSSEEGGRSAPLLAVAYQGHYRPHIVLQSREIRQARVEVRDGQRQVVDEYLGVAFWSGPDPIPISKPFAVTMLLMYAPHPAYDRVVPDAEFTIREGAKIVGYGRVLKRATAPNAEPGAAPKGGPAMPVENSEVAEGPPSVN